MVEHDDPFATLDEVAEVLLPDVVEVAGEVVHDDHVVLAAEILLEGAKGGVDGQPVDSRESVEERVERGLVVVPTGDEERLERAGRGAESFRSGRQGDIARGGPLARAGE